MAIRRICAFGKIYDIEVKRDKGERLLVVIKEDNKTVRKYKVDNGKSVEVRF